MPNKKMKESVIMDPTEPNEQQKKDILSFIKAGKMKKRIITAAIIFVSLPIVMPVDFHAILANSW